MSFIRAAEDKRRLAKLARETKRWWVSGAYYSEDEGRYIRRYRGKANAGAKYCRQRSNRSVRRQGELLQRGEYRKVYDYWWTLF